jgi:hypothetical protein
MEGESACKLLSTDCERWAAIAMDSTTQPLLNIPSPSLFSGILFAT